jgi:hypothetical protein
MMYQKSTTKKLAAKFTAVALWQKITEEGSRVESILMLFWSSD